MWEREREKLFCEWKVCKEWKREWQIYSKSVWIRKDKKKRNMKGDIKVKGSGEMKRYGIEKGYRKCKY